MPLRRSWEQQQQDSFNENTSKADNLRRGLDTAPAQGPASAGIHINTVTNTSTLIHIAYTYTHTGQFSLTSIPSQSNITFSSLLVSQFHLTNFHPNLPQPITCSHYLIHPKNHPRSLLTPTTISLPSPRLSPIHSLHHLDLHLLTTNITHITQKSTNTTQQQHTVM